MKSGRGAESEQIGNFGARVSLEIVTVPELVMRGEKPARVWLNALKRANVVLQIDVPARGVGVFLALRVRGQGIKIGAFPERFR